MQTSTSVERKYIYIPADKGKTKQEYSVSTKLSDNYRLPQASTRKEIPEEENKSSFWQRMPYVKHSSNVRKSDII